MARGIRAQDLLTLLTALGFLIIGALGLTGQITFGPALQLGFLIVAVVFAFLTGVQYHELKEQDSGEARRA